MKIRRQCYNHGQLVIIIIVCAVLHASVAVCLSVLTLIQQSTEHHTIQPIIKHYPHYLQTLNSLNKKIIKEMDQTHHHHQAFHNETHHHLHHLHRYPTHLIGRGEERKGIVQ